MPRIVSEDRVFFKKMCRFLNIVYKQKIEDWHANFEGSTLTFEKDEGSIMCKGVP